MGADEVANSIAAALPLRRKRWINHAHVLRQPRNRCPVPIIEREIDRREVLALARFPCRLWNRGDSVLIQQPLQRHLSGGRTVFDGDRCQCGMVGQAARANGTWATSIISWARKHSVSVFDRATLILDLIAKKWRAPRQRPFATAEA